MADQDLTLALRMQADLQQARRQLQDVERGLGDIARGGGDASEGMRRYSRETDRAESSSQRFTSTVGQIRGLLAGLGVGLAVRQMISYSDTMSSIESQLRLVTGGQDELNKAMQDTYSVAQETRQDLESTVNLYARMARSTEDLNLTHDELLSLTKAINQSFIVSGASAQEAASSTLQLTQAMASGVLRGEELNSVLENSPRLAQAIAEGLGVSIGQLRDLGTQGELTAEQVVRALQRTAGTIDNDFQQMERTVGQAMQQLRNDLLVTFGGGETEGFVTAIDGLRSIVSDPGFQQSMDTLGSAVANLVGWMAKGVSTGTDFTRWAGEELAALANGVAGDDVIRLEQRADEIRDLLNRSDWDVGGLGERLRFFGPTGLVEFWSEEELQTELARLEKQIQDYYSNQPPLLVTGSKDPQDNTDVPPPLPLGGSGDDKKAAREYEAALKALTNLEQGLRQQVATFGEGEAAALEYRLTLGDLSDDVARLGADGQALAASIVQQAKELQTLAEAKEREAEAERERLQAQQQAEQDLQRVLDRSDPVQALERQLELIEELKKLFPQYAAELEQAAGRVRDRIDEISQGLLNATNINAQFAYGATNAMGSFIEDIASGRNEVDSLRDAFRQFAADFLRQLAQMILQQTIFNAIQGASGGIGGVIAGALQFHGGGVVGRGGTGRDLFANVPRYHTGGIAGLAPDEVPAILRKGEEVLTSNDPRHRNNSAGGEAGGMAIYNMIDSDSLAQAVMSSPKGRHGVVNLIKAERAQIKAILR